MKTNLVKYTLIALFTFVSFTLLAQGPPPPPGEPHGGNQDIPGGGAPVGSGLGILLTLGAVYGGRKLYYFSIKNEKLED